MTYLVSPRKRQKKSKTPTRRKASPKLLLAYAEAEAQGWPNWPRKPLNGTPGPRREPIVDLAACPAPAKPQPANPQWFGVEAYKRERRCEHLARLRAEHLQAHGGKLPASGGCPCRNRLTKPRFRMHILLDGAPGQIVERKILRYRNAVEYCRVMLKSGAEVTVAYARLTLPQGKLHCRHVIRLLAQLPEPLVLPPEMIPARMSYAERWDLPEPEPVESAEDEAEAVAKVQDPIMAWLRRYLSGAEAACRLVAVFRYRELLRVACGSTETRLGVENHIATEDNPHPELVEAAESSFGSDGELHYHGVRECTGRGPVGPAHYPIEDILTAQAEFLRVRKCLSRQELKALDLAVLDHETLEAIGETVFDTHGKNAQRKGSAVVQAALDTLAKALKIHPKKIFENQQTIDKVVENAPVITPEAPFCVPLEPAPPLLIGGGTVSPPAFPNNFPPLACCQTRRVGAFFGLNKLHSLLKRKTGHG